MRKTVFLLASLFVMMLATQQMKAQVSASATAAANIITPIQISKAGDLSFGNIVAGTTPGTVTVSPTTGDRSSTGDVILPTATPGTVNAAEFTVTGLADATYAITLPDDNTVTISGPGEEDMTVTGFTSNPSGTGTLAANGEQTLSVGATLNVGKNQAAGNYTGTFNVTVAYN